MVAKGPYRTCGHFGLLFRIFIIKDFANFEVNHHADNGPYQIQHFACIAKYIARQRTYWGRIVEYQLFLHRDLNDFFAKIKLNILYTFGNLKQLCENH
jgi:hypothetical protein